MSDVIKRCDESILTKSSPETEKACSTLYGLIADTTIPFDVPIKNTLHDGIYVRTAFLPKGTTGLGCLLKVPTTLIISGECLVSNGIAVAHSKGYAVLQGQTLRRSFFYAIEDTYLSMIAKVNATTVDEAEKEVTDEWAILTTRKEHNNKET